MEIELHKLKSVKEELQRDLLNIQNLIMSGTEHGYVLIDGRNANTMRIPFDETMQKAVSDLRAAKSAQLEKLTSAIDTAQKVINGLLAD